MDKRIILATALLAFMAFVPGVAAQPSTLSGQVTDQDGNPVAGVTVQLYQWGAGTTEACEPGADCKSDPYPGYFEAQATTGADGRYSFSVQRGWASLNFFKDGYTSDYQNLEVAGDQVLDISMLKYPAKNAHITGTVTGAGAALPYVTISVENPVYGTYECSVIEGEDGGGVAYPETKPAVAPSADGAGSSASSDPAESRMIAPGEPYPGHQGCAITIQKNGSFSGMVTPGYTLLRFYHQDWRQIGGTEYYSKTLVRDLAANATTQLDVDLKARAAPNAIIEGYVVDAKTKAAIAGVYVSLGNMDNYGWANVQTDKDGSYKARLRAGLVQVSIYADGYLPWEGDVTASADGSVRLDIHLTAGQSRYGGCCMAYAQDKSVTGAPSVAEGAASPGAERGQNAGQGDAESRVFVEDLGGGLGPYDPATAPQSGDADTGAPAAKDVPGFEVLAVLLGLLAIALLRRK